MAATLRCQNRFHESTYLCRVSIQILNGLEDRDGSLCQGSAQIGGELLLEKLSRNESEGDLTRSTGERMSSLESLIDLGEFLNILLREGERDEARSYVVSTRDCKYVRCSAGKIPLVAK